jgi:membrane associated rhomboid family serine protease
MVESIIVSWYGPAGSAYYLCLFVGSTLIAHLPGYLKNKDNYGYSAVGASGGVSGVLFASIIIQPLKPLCLYFVLCLPGILFGVLYLWYSHYMGKRGQDNIGHEAHMWGALGGAILIVAFRPSVFVSFLAQLKDAIPF